MGYFSFITASRWGQVGYSFMVGLCGSLLIVIVLAGVMPLVDTIRFLPWVLGFNASVAAYTLMERAHARFKRPKAAGMLIGFVLGLVACGLLNLGAVYAAGATVATMTEALVFSAIAAGFGAAGAWLAGAYAKLKDRNGM